MNRYCDAGFPGTLSRLSDECCISYDSVKSWMFMTSVSPSSPHLIRNPDRHGCPGATGSSGHQATRKTRVISTIPRVISTKERSLPHGASIRGSQAVSGHAYSTTLVHRAVGNVDKGRQARGATTRRRVIPVCSLWIPYQLACLGSATPWLFSPRWTVPGLSSEHAKPGIVGG
jgi:hypothetical protein